MTIQLTPNQLNRTIEPTTSSIKNHIAESLLYIVEHFNRLINHINPQQQRLKFPLRELSFEILQVWMNIVSSEIYLR